jgi:hypothetical protein
LASAFFAIDDLRMKRSVLVREMRIEKNSWLTAVAGIDLP